MILVGGENLIDFIEEPTADGHPVYRAIPGGSPFNTAKAIARQDCDVGYLTPFSADRLGQLLQDNLTSEDRITALAATSTKPTSLAVVSLLDGQAQYQFYREGTAERDITLDSLRDSIPDEVEAFYIGSLALAHGPDAECWEALFHHLGAKGVFTAIDPNIRASFIHDRADYLARLERMIAKADMIKLSDEDISWLFPEDDMEGAAQAIFDRSNAPLVVLTKGSEGAVAYSAHGRLVAPPVQVAELKDTVGAGDTFMGTLIAQTKHKGFLAPGGLADAQESELRAILGAAATAAAINCGRVGCNPPTLAEVSGA